jgi:DNA-binding CsgD family transcriptional regulator
LLEGILVGNIEKANELGVALPANPLPFSERAWRRIARSLNLSARELQIIHGIFSDRKEVAIAEDLGISHHTVHTYLERLYRKLGVSSRVQLVVRVVAEHISGGH